MAAEHTEHRASEQVSTDPAVVGSHHWRKLPPGSRWLLGTAALALPIVAVLLATSLGSTRVETVTAPVTRGPIESTVLATGVLEPFRLVSVGAQVSGQVKSLHVELGQQVKAGQLIAEIDSTTQQNKVSTAEAGLASSQAQRAASAAALARAQATFTRQQELLAVDAVSTADFQSAEADLASARADLDSIDAQIKQAQLELSTARINLGYTRIVAPLDGTVVAIVTEEGQTVNANQSTPTIVKLAALDTMTVNAEISEADVAKVAAGAEVYFTTLGDSRKKRQATLRAIAPAPASIETEDTISSTDSAIYYNGLFDVDNADGALRIGMTAQVSIVLDRSTNALLIPASALGEAGDDGLYTVSVTAEDGGVHPRQVHTGINDGTLVQVLDGLVEGERVVVAQAGTSIQQATTSTAGRPPGGMMMGPPPGGGGAR